MIIFKKILVFFGKFVEVVFNLLSKNRVLNREVIISLTSYKSRINQSFLTLVSLLGQSEKYRIYLFIAEEDKIYIFLLLLKSSNNFLLLFI